MCRPKKMVVVVVRTMQAKRRRSHHWYCLRTLETVLGMRLLPTVCTIMSDLLGYLFSITCESSYFKLYTCCFVLYNVCDAS